MTETYKTVTSEYNPVVSPAMVKLSTYVTRSKTDLNMTYGTYTSRPVGKYMEQSTRFTSLPVIYANNTNKFKRRLDNFCKNQDIIARKLNLIGKLTLKVHEVKVIYYKFLQRVSIACYAERCISHSKSVRLSV